jgi:hypothetical protein
MDGCRLMILSRKHDRSVTSAKSLPWRQSLQADFHMQWRQEQYRKSAWPEQQEREKIPTAAHYSNSLPAVKVLSAELTQRGEQSLEDKVGNLQVTSVIPVNVAVKLHHRRQSSKE